MPSFTSWFTILLVLLPPLLAFVPRTGGLSAFLDHVCFPLFAPTFSVQLASLAQPLLQSRAHLTVPIGRCYRQMSVPAGPAPLASAAAAGADGGSHGNTTCRSFPQRGAQTNISLRLQMVAVDGKGCPPLFFFVRGGAKQTHPCG